MAVLNSWQRIDRVIPGQPWGDGKDGNVTLSATPNVRMTVVGTAGTNSSTVGANTLADGDLVKLITSQGVNTGQWEYNMVLSGGGTTSIVWKETLKYTYASDSQCVKIPRYKEVILSGYTATAWDGTLNGYEEILASKSIIGGGITNLGGYRGGRAQNNPSCQAEGYPGGDGTTRSASANGNGGGGSSDGSAPYGGGAGGGNATNGGTQEGTNPGIAVGSSDLISMFFGGGGGGGMTVNNGHGGKGGGITVLVSKYISATAISSVNGTNGSNATADGGGGGGGAGGSILIVCEKADIGTNQFTATAGAGGSGSGGSRGGSAGSVGRIAIHHSGTVTGTTNPTFTDISDPTLIEKTGAFFAFL